MRDYTFAMNTTGNVRVWSGWMLVLWAGIVSVANAELYRWTDEKGQVFYSDVVPPEDSKRGRSVLNERGVVVDTVAPEKSAEEKAAEERLIRLRAEQQRMLAEQRAHDRILLSSYTAERDLLAARDGKLGAIDAVTNATRGNNERLSRQLATFEENAASLERAGREVGAGLRADIEETRRQIEEGREFMATKEAERVEVMQRFDRDLARFRELKDEERRDLRGRDDAPDPATLGVVSCPVRAQCDKAWSLAQIYVRRHTQLPIQLVTEAIVMTAQPRDDADIGVTVTRIPGKDEGAELFLDLQCRGTPAGDELCAGERSQAIKTGFKPFIDEHLGSAGR